MVVTGFAIVATRVGLFKLAPVPMSPILQRSRACTALAAPNASRLCPVPPPVLPRAVPKFEDRAVLGTGQALATEV